MLPRAHISHSTATRLRVKIPSKKGDAAYFQALKDHFSRFRSVDETHVNPLTGSLLLLSRVSAKTIAQFGAANSLFKLLPPEPNKSTLNEKVLNWFASFNEGIKVSSGGEWDIPSIAFVGLVGAGIYEICMGNILFPAWYTAFWYASSVLLSAKSSKVSHNTDRLASPEKGKTT